MKTKLALALGLSFLAAVPTFAQSSEFDRAFAPRGAEARVTLSIPFGGDSRTPKSKPQLALVGRHYNDNNRSIDWALKNPMGLEAYNESRLAITLSSQPDVFLNDQLLLSSLQEDAYLSDTVEDFGKAALVAGLAAVTVIGIMFLTLDRSESNE